MVRFGRFDASIAWGHIRGSSGPLQKGVQKGVKKGSFWGLRVDLGYPQKRYGGFWTHFGGQKREPGTSKIIKILAKVVKNQGFAILSLDRFLTSILGPSWAHFERVFGAQAIQNRSLR